MLELRTTERPYPGLRPFEPHEADIFFGREAHTDRLLEILQRERFLAVIGPSGSGKSSLVRAGLLPALATGSLGTGSDWRVALLRPGHHPMLRLAQTLLQPKVLGPQLLPANQTEATPADALAAEAELRRGPLGLLHLVRRARQPEGAEGAARQPFNLLVLVDQFEEIFTYAKAGGAQADESDAFVNLLLAAKAEPQARIFVALTMRTDFLGNCVRFMELPEAINRAQYLTPRLKRVELEAAISGPAAVFGGRIEPSLVAELINATGLHEDQLPLVQHALARMWEAARQRQPAEPEVDWAVAEAVGVHHGNVMGALNQHADELRLSLTGEQQLLTEGLFRAITERRQASEGGQDVRRPQQLKLIAEALGCTWETLVPVVQRFAAPEVCFVQHGPGLNAESVIDLSHEALMRQWRCLQSWITRETEQAAGFFRWRERAEDYTNHPGATLSAVDLVRAAEWAGESDSATWQARATWVKRYGGSADDLARIHRCIQASQLALVHATAEKERHARELQEALNKANTALHDATMRRLAADATFMMLGERFGGGVNAIRLALAAYAIEPHVEVMSTLQRFVFGERTQWVKAIETSATSVAFSPDGLRIVSGSWDGTLRFWDAKTGLPIGQPLSGHSDWIRSVAFSPDGLRIVSGSDDNTLRLWDAGSGLPISQPLSGHSDWVTSVAFSPDGLRIVSGSKDKTLQLWDANTGQLIGKPLSGHSLWVTSVAFSPDGLRIVSGSWDDTLRLWNANTGHPIGKPLSGHSDTVTSVAFSPDGLRIASGSQDKTLRLWDAITGRPTGNPLFGHSSSVTSVAFSPDGLHIASGSEDNTLQLWDIKTRLPIRRLLSGHSNSVTSVTFSPNGLRIVSGSDDGTLRLWDVTTGLPLSSHSRGVTSVTFSPDGLRIVSGCWDKTLRLWDANTGLPIGPPLSGHSDWVKSVAFSPDGLRVVSGSDDKTLRLWDAITGLPIGQPLFGHTDEVTSVAFSPNSSRIVSGSKDNTLRLWDANTGLPIGQPLSGHTNGVTSVAFSPNGLRIVSGSWDNTLRLWDATTGLPIGQPLPNYYSGVTSVAFSPDGLRIVSGSRNNTLRLWDANTGQSIGQPLSGHTDDVTSVAFSPDGLHIVAGSYDKTLRLWDANTGLPIGQPLSGHTKKVTSVAFSPNGLRIVSGSEDGTLRLWPAPAAWPALLSSKLTRNFSHWEWQRYVGDAIPYTVQCPGLPIPANTDTL